MPYMLVMIMVLIISWAMMVNIAKLMQERMMLQNAADNAAISVAVFKARTLNALGYLNYLIACTLYDGEVGLALGKFVGCEPPGIFNYFSFGTWDGPYGWCPPWTPFLFFWMCLNDSQKMVGSALDIWHGGRCPGTEFFSYELYGKNIERTKFWVSRLREYQDAFYGAFLMNVLPYAEKVASLNSEGYEFKKEKLNIWMSPLFNVLGLYRNKNGIKYYNTQSMCHSVPPNPEWPSYHLHFFWTEAMSFNKENDCHSWLYADKSIFSKSCKVMIILKKKIEKKGFIFSKWIGLDDVEMEAVSSAAVYNRNGPMFPLETRDHPSDKISPVFKEYLRAQYGGWDAQLVPSNYLRIVQH